MKKIVLLFLFFAMPLSAQTAAITDYCLLGAKQAATSGLNSINYLQGVIPQCTVTVYLTGTTNLATIYSDSSLSPLTNPFTANTNGLWLFYAAINQGYDVVLSGGVSPNVYLSPVTITGLYPGTDITAGITQLIGDVLAGPGNGSQTSTVVAVNNSSIPVSKTIVGTNSSGQLIDATSSTLSNNTTGNAATATTATNVSGGTALVTSVTDSGLSVNGYVTTTSGLLGSVATIPNAGLTNSATTVNGTTCTLGSSCTVTASPISANSVFAFTGTSWNDDDNGAQSTAITVTGWTCASGVCTFTNSGVNGFNSGEWVNVRYLSSWFTPPSPVIIGTGYTLFQVLSTGLSSTQFEISYSLNTGSCSTSCGTVESAMNNLPFQVTSQPGMPSTALANTVMLLPTDVTIVGEAANYTALFHAISPAVTGKPGYLTISDPWNDIGLCSTVSTIETAYTSLIASAHTDGWKVVIPSIPAKNISQQYGASFCSFPAPPYEEMMQIDQWLRALGPSTLNRSSGAYWDYFVDVGRIYNDPLNTAMNYGSPTAWQLFGAAEADALVSGSGMPEANAPMYFGAAAGTGNTFSNGYTFHPSDDTGGTYQWLANDYSLAVQFGTASGYKHFTVSEDTASAIVSTDSGGGTALAISNTSDKQLNPMLSMLVPGISTTTYNNVWTELGVANSTNNSLETLFHYVGAGSTSNYGTIGLNGVNGIKLDGAGNVYVPGIATSASTAPICPNGTNGALTTTGCASGGSGITATFGTTDPRGINTPTLVQTNTSTNSSGATAFTSSVVSGNLLVDVALGWSGDCSSVSLSDTITTSFTKIVSESYGSSCLVVYLGLATSSGSDTLSFSGFTEGVSSRVYEFNGATTTLDGSATTNFVNSTTDTLSMSTNYTNDLILSGIGMNNSTATYTTSTSGYTASGQVTYSGESAMNAAYQVLASAGSSPITWNISPSGAANDFVFALKANTSPVAGTEGNLYFQTSSGSYVEWVYHNSEWHQVQ